MYLKKLILSGFRNYKERCFSFNHWGAFLYGNNGAGKTNILEAIYMLAYIKSFRTNKNNNLIQWENSEAKITGIYTDCNGLDNEIILQFNKKKNVHSMVKIFPYYLIFLVIFKLLNLFPKIMK